jgi:hypothetical protein
MTRRCPKKAQPGRGPCLREKENRVACAPVSANQSGSGAGLQSLSSKRRQASQIAPASIRDVYSIAGRISGMDSTSSSTTSRSEHWQFLRDVMVFQLKLLLDNLRDFALVPISIVAALIDLIYEGEREGALFYKVLRWGAHSEDVINVYSAIEHHPPGDFKVNPAYTVDAVIARLQGVVVREYEKGGTAASIKAAMDRAIDQLHRETKEKGDRARECGGTCSR